ncbi:unnamed protein product [Adineta steineri]|uniref:Uncharacterized protein n=1 Tax=Adineta steineri TaxID=433720 RepID=A0A814FLR4_9BILA|nr:unnamed protein product [Adineta steineri]CAF1011403.1 unnamed protein product [Adineta steineri]
MSNLEQLHLNICSTILLNDQIYLPSLEDIQYSFEYFPDIQISSCINYFSEEGKGHCHIYSYPFTIRIYPNIANNFPGGLFTCVSEISLFDEHPFEHEFFVRISRSFPLLKRLTIRNGKPQCGKSKNIRKFFSIIQYSHLESLNFETTHDDYIEQFLIDTRTYLPSNITLSIDYKSLRRVTHKFTRKATRLNCEKINYICLEKIRQLPKYFKNYFFEICMCRP